MNRLWLIAAVARLFFSSTATADDATVIIVGADAQKSLVDALRLELDAAAFQARVLWRSPKPEPFADFAAVADASEAAAWIRLFDNGRVDIWTRAPESDKVLHRETLLDKTVRSQPQQAAMEIAELLRATRMELFEVDAAELMTPKPNETATAAPAPDPKPERVPEKRETTDDAAPSSTQAASDAPLSSATSPHRLLLEIGPNVAAGSFSHPPAIAIYLAAEWRPIERFGIALFGDVPLTPIRFDGVAGRVTLKNGVVGAEARIIFPELLKRFRPSIGLGAALLAAHIEGEAAPGFQSQQTTFLTLGVHIGLMGAIRITRRLAFTFAGRLTHAPRGITVAIAGERAFSWGDIILNGLLGLQVGLL